MSEAPDLTKPYDPTSVEGRWYEHWEKNGVFDANDDASDPRPAYVIPMPPPNVTGSLHMGHAQRCTLEDALTRWHRMRGFNVLWQPGIDHAGIATQTVVERLLLREGKTRHDLGREKFLERVWAWKNESGGRIALQQRVLGASPDWRRSKFTMDDSMSHAVGEAFVRLYEEGLMYRATRLINWCPECRTALSDLEVETEENANGELFEFAYKVDGSDDVLVVATTRPETMLGDTAVAVHPDDARYTRLHGKKLVHPFVDRLVPVITDAILVDPKFGTGAVKVTPAHDFNDFATGKRHGLEEINIFNLDGTMNENTGPFVGLDRKRARTAVKKALDEKGLARGAKPHQLALPRCQRSGGVVEPMISTQWFLKMKDMADAALEAVHSGRIEVIPASWVKTYDHFLENIQDWCVSRQLWWGHQIPAWHGPNGEIRVARTRPAECTEEAGWTQDPDVLDTWFSSALWPFATLGWPEKTPALAKFYPTNPAQASDLETGYDILFFWVARMIMFGLHFTKEVPFRRVLLSGLIVDETGEKMSKVKGNVIDPLDLIHGTTFAAMVEKTAAGAPPEEALAKFKKAYPSAAQMGQGFPAFGTDAVRLTLASYPPSNMRIALAPKRIEGNRHFINKIWNATRLVLELLGDWQRPSDAVPEPTEDASRWLLSKLARSATIAGEGIGSFRVDETTAELYRFFWYDFCDWYLEIAKTILRKDDAGNVPRPEVAEETRAVLAHVLDACLRLMHPLIPFVTEELWQRLPRAYDPGKSIALARYPDEKDGRRDEKIEKEFALVQSVISAVRTIRSEHGIEWRKQISVRFRTDDVQTRTLLQGKLGIVRFLVNTAGDAVVEASGGPREAGTVADVVPSELGAIEILVALKGLVTKDEELARIDRELKRIDKDLASIEKKLSSKGFTDRAPKEVVDEAHGQKKSFEEAKGRLVASRVLAEEL
ncbi:valine--tRNA ligase [soil metagenome]